MAIDGLHAVIETRDETADRAFFRDVLGLPWVDAGNGRLFFASPPTEIAFRGAEWNDTHLLYLMCDDVAAEVARLGEQGVACAPIEDKGWGLMTTIPLPGGGHVGLYEPRHARAHGSTDAAA